MSDPGRSSNTGQSGDDPASWTASAGGTAGPQPGGGHDDEDRYEPAAGVAHDSEGWDEAATEAARYPAGSAATDDRSLGELFGELTRDLADLFRSELELARTELTEEARKAGRAGGMVTAGAATGYLALILAAFAAAWGLAEVIAAGWAFLVIAVVVGAIAAVLLMKGRQEVGTVRPVPDQTVETLKEDAQWARAQVK
jgi:hypothetical protein